MIECIRFKSHVKGALQGFADLYVPQWGVEIPGFSLFMKDGRRWVNAPGSEYEVNGEKKFKAFFFFREKAHWEAFGRQAKDAIDKWCAENPQNEVEEQQETEIKVDECPF